MVLSAIIFGRLCGFENRIANQKSHQSQKWDSFVSKMRLYSKIIQNKIHLTT